MKHIFTIVARNYVGLAISLGRSIRQFNSLIPFTIVVADGTEGVDFSNYSEFSFVDAKDIDVPDYDSLAYKYNVTEFCTALKPFAFSYFFKTGVERAIYLDPDILFYKDIEVIFSKLDSHFVVLTPHFLTPEVSYTGNAPETLTLFAGIYNLGFLALKYNSECEKLLRWWENRLYQMCYADKTDALHVDQKWMDFVPALFGNGVMICREMGWNIAYWNIHEREIVRAEGHLCVKNRISNQGNHDLVFIHFSGVNPEDIYNNRQCPTLNLQEYPDWLPLIVTYSEIILNQTPKEYLSLKYKYNYYDNGEMISAFHRRLYRRVIDEQIISCSDIPFHTKSSPFYKLLKKNKLLINGSVNLDKLNERNYKNFDKKLQKINKLFSLLKALVGAKYYILFTKFALRYFRPENQLFLIKEFREASTFVNENVKR